MRHFGIIGKPLVQSFSARYFNQKFEDEQIEAEYSLYPLEEIGEVIALFDRLVGMNVTIPYKVAVIPYLDRLDETAEAIGAVNVIRIGHRDGKTETTGYNTDAIGFMESMKKLVPYPTTPEGRVLKAVVLGSGGASKACVYGLRKIGLDVEVASRSTNSYPLDPTGYDVIVNATPLGMYPQVADCPDIQYDKIHEGQIAFDCIYNPEQTEFLRRCQAQGARTQNGMEMLYGQAEAAAKIWGI